MDLQYWEWCPDISTSNTISLNIACGYDQVTANTANSDMLVKQGLLKVYWIALLTLLSLYQDSTGHFQR